MYDLFQEIHPGICSRKSYARRIQMKNISFCKLGEEECEVCEAITHHICKREEALSVSLLSGTTSIPAVNRINLPKQGITERIETITPGECRECDTWVDHIRKAKQSRAAYRKDRDTYPEDGVFYFSADMQKVIMLPRLPGNKTSVFTRRIILFHETFAPLVPEKKIKAQWKKEGKAIRKEEVIGTVWHEGIHGRNDEDVCSTLIKIMNEPQYRDANEVVQWADNCTGQMKNWTLYCALVHEVNNGSVPKVTIKYFEKGHTFMSADSFHAMVESNMRSKKNLYDFQDFVNCISSNAKAVEMAPSDFLNFANKMSNGKDTNHPYLKDIAVVQFRKGSTQMFWKVSHDDDIFQHGEFIQKKQRQGIIRGIQVPQKDGPRGVTSSKKHDILKKIGPMMPKNRMAFWENLEESESSKDLTVNYEHLMVPSCTTN